MKASDFFSKQQQDKILTAITDAEKNTSGEIRVHIETRCKGNVLDCAANTFKLLKMHKTELRNGVLIYLSIETREFAIIGDAGINNKVPADFWNSTKDLMLEQFKKSEYVEGLTRGIQKAGEQLKKFFPYEKGDINELPDDISYGK